MLRRGVGNPSRHLVGVASVVILVSSLGVPVLAGVQGSPDHVDSLGRALAAAGGPHYHGSSENWAGYVVSTPNGAVTNVVGSWVVPKFHGSCQSLDNESSAAFWVGMDGWSDDTVEQIGTSITCTSFLYIWGVSYTAWYEFYPAGSVGISMTIHPGDVMVADVSYTTLTSTFTLSMNDTTTGKTFAVSETGVAANRSSAEWIAESPSDILGILPWVNFKEVHFSDSYATISGQNDSISNFPSSDPYWQVDSYTESGVLKGATSDLSDKGTKFRVTWKTYGP
jgi:hypothetical protein